MGNTTSLDDLPKRRSSAGARPHLHGRKSSKSRRKKRLDSGATLDDVFAAKDLFVSQEREKAMSASEIQRDSWVTPDNTISDENFFQPHAKKTIRTAKGKEKHFWVAADDAMSTRHISRSSKKKEYRPWKEKRQDSWATSDDIVCERDGIQPSKKKRFRSSDTNEKDHWGVLEGNFSTSVLLQPHSRKRLRPLKDGGKHLLEHPDSVLSSGKPPCLPNFDKTRKAKNLSLTTPAEATSGGDLNRLIKSTRFPQPDRVKSLGKLSRSNSPRTHSRRRTSRDPRRSKRSAKRKAIDASNQSYQKYPIRLGNASKKALSNMTKFEILQAELARLQRRKHQRICERQKILEMDTDSDDDDEDDESDIDDSFWDRISAPSPLVGKGEGYASISRQDTGGNEWLRKLLKRREPLGKKQFVPRKNEKKQESSPMDSIEESDSFIIV